MLPDEISSAPDAVLWEQLNDAEGSDRGALLFELGNRRRRADDREAALGPFEAAAAAFEQSGDVYDAAESYFRLGQMEWQLDRNGEAIDAFTRAATLFDECAATGEIGDCHYFIGRALVDDDRLPESLEAFEIAISHNEAAGQLAFAANAALHRGQTLGVLGRQVEALEVFDQARAWYRSLGEASDVARADDRRAAALIDLGRMREAINVLQNCVFVADTAGDIKARAYTAYRLGWTLRMDGQFEACLPVLARAREAYQEDASIKGMAWCDREVAHALEGLSKFDEADELYVKCRATLDALGDDHQIDLVDSARADNFIQAGLPERALPLQLAVVERTLSRDPWLAAGVASRTADNLCSMGRYAEALDVIEQTTQAAEAFGEEHAESNLRRLVHALAAAGLGDKDSAGQLCEQALADLAETDLLHLRARLHRLHGQLLQESSDAGATKELAYAVALFLASGHVAEATEVSKEFQSPATARPPLPSSMNGQELRDLSQQEGTERGGMAKVTGSAPDKKGGHDGPRQNGPQGAT